MSEKTPSHIRTFNFFGCDMKPPKGGEGNWAGDCVLCGKDKHFFADETEGTWDCKVCGERGNQISFLKKVHEKFDGFADDDDWEKLSKHRKIPVKYLQARGLRWTGEFWMLPCYSETGTIRDLRCYDFKQLMSTAGCKVQLFGMRELAKAKQGSNVWHCEGEWDAIAMDWLLDEAGLSQKDIAVAVPGANTFKPEWIKHYAGKNVTACYDNDKAGDEGAVKAYESLKATAKKLQFVNWPRANKTGYDLRDFITESLVESTSDELMLGLKELTERVPRLVKENGDEVDKPLDADLKAISFGEVVEAFRKNLHMNEDLEQALKVMMAAAMSEHVPGDPLWMFLVGPSSSGKTQILSSFAGSSHTLFVSNVGPHSLISGFRGEGGADPSLLAKANGKTMVFKDFTEVLSKPQPIRDEMFSILRGAYDGSVSRPFGNGVVRQYDNLHFSVLAGVTHAIHGYNNTSLGERFLKFQFKTSGADHISSVLDSAISNVGKEKAIEDSLKKAVASYLVNEVDSGDLPAFPMKYLERLKALVQLIANLRSNVERDPRTQEIVFRPVPEAGTRLAKQLVKLGMMIAWVDAKPEVDDATYALVERVAFDTAYGFHLDVVDAILSLGGEATRGESAIKIRMPLSTLHRRFDDLQVMGIITISPTKRPPEKAGGNPPLCYNVHPHIASLWQRSKGLSWKAPQAKTTAKDSQPASPTKKLVLRRSSERSEHQSERLS